MADFASRLPVTTDNTSTINIQATTSTLPVSGTVNLGTTTATIPVSFATTSTIGISAGTISVNLAQVTSSLANTTGTLGVVISSFAPSGTQDERIAVISAGLTGTIPVSFSATSTIGSAISGSATAIPAATGLPVAATYIKQNFFISALAGSTSTDLAALVITSGTGYLTTFQTAASGQHKAQIRVGSSTFVTGFGTAANPNVYFVFNPPLQVSTAASGSIILVLVNRESSAQDVYATWTGWSG